MNKKRQKKIKKLRRVHMLPNIIILLVLLFFLTQAMFAFVAVSFSVMLENHLDESTGQAVQLAREIEEQNKEKSDDLLIDFEALKEKNEFTVYNKKGKIISSSGDKDPRSDKLYRYEYDNEEVFFCGENIADSLDQVNELKALRILSGFVAKNTGRSDFDSEWKKQEAFSVSAWTKVPVFNGKYMLYYQSDVVLNNKEVGYLLMILLFAGALIAVPVFLYIITFVVSYFVQRKNTKLIYMDVFTSQKNWLYFREEVGRKIRKRKKKKQAIVSIRFDKYQNFCACYGPDEGANLIEMFSGTIKNNLEKKELSARYNDAEFGIYMSMVSREQCEDRMQTIINSLKRCAGDRKIEISCGICEITQESRDVDELYNHAVIARRTISSDVTNRIAWFNEALQEEKIWESKVEETMERALANNEFQVYIQPKYNAVTRELGGAEALVRWISPTEGFIGPGRFIPIFEKNGFITKIDDFMLKSVAKLQADWIAQGKNVVPVSVNISRAHFTQLGLAEHLCKIVEESGAPKESIEFELTESAFFEDKDVLIETVERLRDMGFSISMDDFGAGYSSLNSLKDLSLDVLKVDAEFFRGSGIDSEKGSIIVAETIKLAKSLGMKIVAEGIEEEKQVEFLAENGCDLIQGFYFAKPMPVSEYEQRMS